MLIAIAGSRNPEAMLEWERQLKAGQEPQVVLTHRPAMQHGRLEAISQLRIGLNGIEGILRADAHDGQLQLVAQVFDDVEKRPLP